MSFLVFVKKGELKFDKGSKNYEKQSKIQAKAQKEPMRLKY